MLCHFLFTPHIYFLHRKWAKSIFLAIVSPVWRCFINDQTAWPFTLLVAVMTQLHFCAFDSHESLFFIYFLFFLVITLWLHILLGKFACCCCCRRWLDGVLSLNEEEGKKCPPPPQTDWVTSRLMELLFKSAFLVRGAYEGPRPERLSCRCTRRKSAQFCRRQPAAPVINWKSPGEVSPCSENKLGCLDFFLHFAFCISHFQSEISFTSQSYIMLSNIFLHLKGLVLFRCVQFLAHTTFRLSVCAWVKLSRVLFVGKAGSQAEGSSDTWGFEALREGKPWKPKADFSSIFLANTKHLPFTKPKSFYKQRVGEADWDSAL